MAYSYSRMSNYNSTRQTPLEIGVELHLRHDVCAYIMFIYMYAQYVLVTLEWATVCVCVCVCGGGGGGGALRGWSSFDHVREVGNHQRV